MKKLSNNYIRLINHKKIDAQRRNSLNFEYTIEQISLIT